VGSRAGYATVLSSGDRPVYDSGSRSEPRRSSLEDRSESVFEGDSQQTSPHENGSVQPALMRGHYVQTVKRLSRTFAVLGKVHCLPGFCADFTRRRSSRTSERNPDTNRQTVPLSREEDTSCSGTTTSMCRPTRSIGSSSVAGCHTYPGSATADRDDAGSFACRASRSKRTSSASSWAAAASTSSPH